MDKRKSYYIVFDTETCNGFMVDDKLDLSCSLVYDIGWQIIDKQGNIYVKRSFINSEIFYGERDIMQSAYYANKILNYENDINNGSRIVTTFYHIRQAFLNDCKEWNVKAAVAHNARFDYNATNTTYRWLTKSKYRYFLPYGLPLWDSLKMASDTIGKEKGYKAFCERNGFLTKHKVPRVRLTAEILYRYISGNVDFEESHTGLEDVEIESEIFITCLKKHKKMRKNVWGD